MPNLENLKKQAKLVLRWHRTRYHPVAAQIRTMLPRFRDLSDAEVLDRGFKLGDAQELVARQSGFESWQALKQGLGTMPQQPRKSQKPKPSSQSKPSSQPKPSPQSKVLPARAVLSGIAAQLFVADITAACAYFVDKLGFSVAFTWGEPAFYAQVRRDGARINLRHVDKPVIDPALRERESLLSADIAVDTAAEIKQLFIELQSAGVDFHQTLRREPWGARNFIVRDPDGNLILFAGPAE